MGYSQIILNSFPAPTNLCGDLAFDGQYLWIGGQAEYVIFQISTIDGSVIRTIPTTIRSPYGLTFDGKDLWISDSEKDSIQRINIQNGDIISVYPSPKSTPTSPKGLAWDGENVWNNDYGEYNGSYFNNPYDSTFAINSEGIRVKSFAAFGQGPSALGFGDGYLFSADTETDQVFIIDAESFSLIDSFPVVGGTHPNGLAWDGDYLWLSNNDRDSIYQLDISSVITNSISNNKEYEFEVSLYPNPCTDIINIDLNTFSNPIFELIDINGKVLFPFIKSNSDYSYSLDVSSLNKGLYYLAIQIDDTRKAKLILKQ